MPFNLENTGLFGFPLSLPAMLKRFVTSFCILMAFAILQAHNFIAHHHDHEITIHHDTDHEDNDHGDEGLLNHALGHLNHNFENRALDYVSTHVISCSKKLSFQADHDILLIAFLQAYYLPPPLLKPIVYQRLHCPSIYQFTPVLRGPPAII